MQILFICTVCSMQFHLPLLIFISLLYFIFNFHVFVFYVFLPSRRIHEWVWPGWLKSFGLFFGFFIYFCFLSIVFGFLLNIIYVCRFQLSDCGIVYFQLFERVARLFFFFSKNFNGRLIAECSYYLCVYIHIYPHIFSRMCSLSRGIYVI